MISFCAEELQTFILAKRPRKQSYYDEKSIFDRYRGPTRTLFLLSLGERLTPASHALIYWRIFINEYLTAKCKSLIYALGSNNKTGMNRNVVIIAEKPYPASSDTLSQRSVISCFLFPYTYRINPVVTYVTYFNQLYPIYDYKTSY